MNISPVPFGQRFSPEMKLLLAAARRFMTEAEGRDLRDLCAAGLDWQAFAALVQRHRLPGLVFHNLDRFAKEALPPGLLQSLRQQAEKNRQHEMSLAA
jgi:hypothetical protein